MKLTRKHLRAEGTTSNLHFTTLVNILPKLRYFERRIYIKVGKLVKRFIQYFCFPDRPIKCGDILDLQKGGNLRKGGEVRPPLSTMNK